MIKCPVDDFTLAPHEYEGVTVDSCPHCQGMWLDAGELETIQNTHGVDDGNALETPENLAAAAEDMGEARGEAQLSCVKCDAVLTKKEYGFASLIMVDSCPKGDGIWLDKGELQKLETFYERQQEIANKEETEILKEIENEDKVSEGISGFFAGLFKSLQS